MNLTVDQIDILQELVNIGVGRAAGVLNEMIGSPICLRIPYIKLLSPPELCPELKKRFNGDLLSTVRLNFSGAFSGTAELIFPTESASTLVEVLTDEVVGTPDLDSVKIGTLLEVGNIVLNGVMGSLSNVLAQHLEYSLPTYLEGMVDRLLMSKELDANASVFLAHTRFTIEQLQIAGDIILIFKVGSFDAMLKAIELAFESDDERDSGCPERFRYS
ncbi:chemotaxis protein CheC [Aerosakkonema sp. BLCC-F183]|uniref:chemotaxis protein CheC n=1 Tax=Aerosakkonema sp. BLCC-F183 TaxID=3342834 RepID=UPI0035B7DEF7